MCYNFCTCCLAVSLLHSFSWHLTPSRTQLQRPKMEMIVSGNNEITLTLAFDDLQKIPGTDENDPVYMDVQFHHMENGNWSNGKSILYLDVPKTTDGLYYIWQLSFQIPTLPSCFRGGFYQWSITLWNRSKARKIMVDQHFTKITHA